MYLIGDVQKKVVIHDETDTDQQADIKRVPFEHLVDAAAFHVDCTGKPHNGSTLGLEFPLDHVAEMNSF